MSSRELPNLKDHLMGLINAWDSIPIRVEQDGRYFNQFLSEVKDGIKILEWIIDNKGRFWE